MPARVLKAVRAFACFLQFMAGIIGKVKKLLLGCSSLSLALIRAQLPGRRSERRVVVFEVILTARDDGPRGKTVDKFICQMYSGTKSGHLKSILCIHAVPLSRISPRRGLFVKC